METRQHDRSHLNSFERRLQWKDLKICELEKQLAESTRALQQVTLQLQEERSRSGSRANQIGQLQAERSVCQRRVDSLREVVSQQEEQYRELYRVAMDNSEPCRVDLSMLAKQFGMEKMLLETKLQMQHDQIELLEKALKSKNESIVGVVSENTVLKGRELSMVAEYHNSIAEMKKLLANQQTFPQHQPEIVQSKDNFDGRADAVLSAAYEQLLELKEAEVELLMESNTKNSAELRRVLRELEAVSSEKQVLLQRAAFEGTFTEEMATYKSMYEREKQKLERLHSAIPQLQEYIQRLNSFVADNTRLQQQERRIRQLQFELQELGFKSKDQADVLRQENVRLSKREQQLSMRICEMEQIIGKYDQAFKVMNPYFGIYGYSLADLTGKETDLVKELEQAKQRVQQANNKATEYNVLAAAVRYRDEELGRYREEMDKLTTELTTHQRVVMAKLGATSTNEAALRAGCLSIIRQLVDGLHSLKQQYQAVKTEVSDLRRQLGVVLQPQLAMNRFLNAPPIVVHKSPLVAVECPMLPPLPSYNEALYRLESDIKAQRKQTLEVEKRTGDYLKHFSTLQATISQFKCTLRAAKAQNIQLSNSIKERDARVEQLQKMIAQKSSTSVPAPLVTESVINITDLSGQGHVSEQSIQQFSQLIDRNVELVERMEHQYSLLKENYEKVLASTLDNVTQQYPAAAGKSTPDPRLIELSLRLKQAELNEKSLSEQSDILKQQNSRLMASIVQLQERIECEKKIQLGLVAAIESEHRRDEEHREQVAASHSQSSATDSRLVSSLTDLIRDKNSRIEILEQVRGMLVQRLAECNQVKLSMPVPEYDKGIFINVEENLAELLDHAAHMIESLQGQREQPAQ